MATKKTGGAWDFVRVLVHPLVQCRDRGLAVLLPEVHLHVVGQVVRGQVNDVLEHQLAARRQQRRA